MTSSMRVPCRNYLPTYATIGGMHVSIDKSYVFEVREKIGDTVTGSRLSRVAQSSYVCSPLITAMYRTTHCQQNINLHLLKQSSPGSTEKNSQNGNIIAVISFKDRHHLAFLHDFCRCYTHNMAKLVCCCAPFNTPLLPIAPLLLHFVL